MSGSTTNFTSTIKTFYSSFPSSSYSSSSSNFLRFSSLTPQISSQVDPQSSRCLFTLIPPEIFINVCQFLSPWDLFTISLVCKKFREYLTCPTSTTTMNIWRTSRLNSVFFPQLPSPDGLNEIDYCKVAMLEKGCQFCSGKNNNNVRIYWMFRVRSCWNCLMSRIECIPQGHSIPDFASGLPFEIFRMLGMFGPEHKVFWKSDYKLAEIEFSKVKESERKKWIERKFAERESFIADALNRGKADDDSKEIHNQEKMNKIRYFCYLMLETYSDSPDLKVCNDVRESVYSPYILSLCPTFNETIALPNHLFDQVTFKSWRNKMIQDYKQIEMRYSIPTRYNQIYQKLLRKRWFFGSLRYWIEHCETYICPPYINNDPRNSWSEEYLDKFIIPKILCEAIECEKKARDARIALQLVESLIFQKINNLENAIAFGLGGNDSSNNNGLEIFRCKICEENTSNHLLYSYRQIKNHLTQKHSIKIDLDKYIEIDHKIIRNRFTDYSDNWFKTGNYPYELPENIMQFLKIHRMPWWKPVSS